MESEHITGISLSLNRTFKIVSLLPSVDSPYQVTYAGTICLLVNREWKVQAHHSAERKENMK